MTRLFILFAVVMSALMAHADVYDEGARAALSYHQGTVDSLLQMQFNERAQIAINQMVKTANEALTEQGYTAEANQNQEEWDQNFSAYFLNFNFLNLGDHKPLNDWLDQFYKKTESKLGTPVMKLLHLDDIRTLNYAIPVVFQPAGDKRNGDHWNQAEYTLHFVPFAAVVTYWGSLTACKLVALHGVVPLKRWCGLIAQILRGAMTNMIAPKLSKFVYSKEAGQGAQLDLDFVALDQHYETEVSQVQKQ